jgi:hypothetical protein
MRPVTLLCPLLLAACTPQAILLVDGGDLPRRKPTGPSTPVMVEEPPATQPAGAAIGLLEPRTLTQMPEERDMRPTVDPQDPRPVIGTPPPNE